MGWEVVRWRRRNLYFGGARRSRCGPTGALPRPAIRGAAARESWSSERPGLSTLPAGVVRQAEPGDAAALVELGRAVGTEPEGWLITVDDWRGAAEERRYLRALRRYPHAAVFVAEDEEEGELVGRISLARDQHPASYHVADLGLMVVGLVPAAGDRPGAARGGGRLGARARA